MTEPEAPRPGRRSLLTPELQDKIVRVVKAGNYLKVAAQYNGVGESTLRLWLQRGRAAAAVRDKHDPDRLYCPDCDTDRTSAVEEVQQQNLHEDEQEDDQPRRYAALGPCPTCHSDEHPRTWTLDPVEAPYLAFLEAITQAETAAEVAAVTHWRAAFADDWRAARDFLVRKNPASWAATTRVTMSQEEADRRIDAAAEQVLVAVGVDTDQLAEGHLMPGEADTLGALDLDTDDDWQDGDGDA
jgi:transposase